MVRYMQTFLVNHDWMIGDATKDTNYFLSQGFSEEHIKTAKVAWICLKEVGLNRSLLVRVLASKSPSVG